MSCSCVEHVNDLLAPGAKLELAIMFRDNELIARPYSRILRKDNGRPETRRSKAGIFAFSHCPFCGVAYDAEPAARVEGASK
ncbi:MAG: hypothetical protein JWQ16_1729 [Novosphingobium sp.]|nr:hypothetical protein [Novosphingobium sp.]